MLRRATLPHMRKRAARFAATSSITYPVGEVELEVLWPAAGPMSPRAPSPRRGFLLPDHSRVDHVVVEATDGGCDVQDEPHPRERAVQEDDRPARAAIPGRKEKRSTPEGDRGEDPQHRERDAAALPRVVPPR